jgi:sugar phosphate isomerase/epimerase
MPLPTPRRDFLSTLSVTALGSALWSSTGQSAPAADKVQRHGKAHFKFSLAAYSYRDLFKNGTCTLHDFIDDCVKFGLDGTELTSYYFPSDVTATSLAEIRARCFRQGLDVSGTAIGNDFGMAAGEKRTQQIALTKTWIDRAVILGAPVIRIFAGHIPKDADPAASKKLMIAGMEECCQYAGEKGIHLALENHGGPTATAAGLLELVHAVKSPWLGVNWDSGNFHSTDVYAELAEVAPYAINAQVKVVTSGPDKKKVPTDFAKIGKILKDAGYRGYVALEYEETGDPRTECPKYLDQLRTALA